MDFGINSAVLGEHHVFYSKHHSYSLCLYMVGKCSNIYINCAHVCS